MFDIVLKFHDQNFSVVKVITIPVIIQKMSLTYLFIGRSNSYIVAYAGGRSYGVQLANSVCETHVEQKISRLE